jgi:hypothetical protein
LRVLLVDCEQRVAARTLSAAFGKDLEAYETTTAWRGGQAPLDLHNADVIFINANYDDLNSSSLHSNEGEHIQTAVEKGAAVFVFVGSCKSFHLKNLLGDTVFVGAQQDNSPTACSIAASTALDPVFANLGNLIYMAQSLMSSSDAGSEWQDILKNTLNTPIALLRSKFRGRCAYLPHFGAGTKKAIELILREVVPELSPHLVYDEQLKWLEETQFLMPSAAKLRQDRERLKSDYERQEKELRRRYNEELEKVRTGWNELLISSGDTVKLAIKRAFKLFGWHVVDVDDFWKTREPDRQKEEDLWVSEETEPHPSKEGVLLVEVKSSERRAASEGDYSQLVKYLNRRKSEFKNSGLSGILAINHAFLTRADSRPSAFSEAIIADSKRDGVGLVTTWELFKAVQKILAREIEPNTVRTKLSSPGLVHLS